MSTARAKGEAESVIDGVVTLTGVLSQVSVIRVADQEAALVGVQSGASGTGVLDNVTIDCQNNGGPAYSVYMTAGGNITARKTVLLAEVGTDGYSAWVSAGTFRHESGLAIGTAALTPYWKEV